MEFLGLRKFSSCREPDRCGFQKMMGFRHSQNRNKSFYHPVRIPRKISIKRLTGDGSITTPSRAEWAALWA